MLNPEHMDMDNTATIDGSDIEMINVGLQKINRAKEICDMLGMVFFALDDAAAKGIKAVEEARDHWCIRRGIAASFDLIGDTLREAEEQITGIIEENEKFADQQAQNSYDILYRRKEIEPAETV